MFKILPSLPEKILPQNVRSAGSTVEALEWFNRVAQPLTDVFRNQNYLVANRFSTADIVVGGVLLWAKKLGMLSDPDPLTQYIDHLMQRPAFIRADEDFYGTIVCGIPI